MDIHDGCENGNIHLVVTLLKEGKATLADRDENGNTPLHNACLGAQIKLVRLFLGQSVDYTYISDGEQGGAVAVQIRTQGEDPDEEATEEFGRTAVKNFSLPKHLTINVQALTCRQDYRGIRVGRSIRCARLAARLRLMLRLHAYFLRLVTRSTCQRSQTGCHQCPGPHTMAI